MRILIIFLLFLLTPAPTSPLPSQCITESSLDLSYVHSSLLGDSIHPGVDVEASLLNDSIHSNLKINSSIHPSIEEDSSLKDDSIPSNVKINSSIHPSIEVDSSLKDDSIPSNVKINSSIHPSIVVDSSLKDDSIPSNLKINSSIPPSLEVDSLPLDESIHYSVKRCLADCLAVAPGTSHVMVMAGEGGQLKCFCGFRGALAKAEYKNPVECDGSCSGGSKGWKCGNKTKKLLSVYCVLAFCDTSKLPKDFCSQPKSNTIHGCISGQVLNWTNIHNITSLSSNQNMTNWSNFYNMTNFKSNCILECGQWGAGNKTIALIRRINKNVTCSCVHQASFPITQLITPPFCKFLGNEENYYNVTCVQNNLIPDNITSQFSTLNHTSCQKSYIGCVYNNLFNKEKAHKIDIHHPLYEEPEMCQKICAAAFSSSSSVGIRWNRNSSELECWCSKTVHPESSFGPEIWCNITCPVEGSLSCGGPSSLSVYCVDGSEGRDLVELDRAGERVVADHIFENAKKFDVTVDVILILLAATAVSLLISVGMLCHQRGLNTFTKDGM